MRHHLFPACRRIAAVALVIAAPFASRAQTGSVGIGTPTPDASAVLDVRATAQGVSFPNLSLTSESDATTISSPMPGLLVFNTNTALPCGKGLYVNNGTVTAPVWACFTKTTQHLHAYDTGGRSSFPQNTLTVQPGCTLTFTVPMGQVVDVKVEATVGAQLTSQSVGLLGAVVFLDGSQLPRGGRNAVQLSSSVPTSSTTLSTWVSGLTGGTHTIDLRTANFGGTNTLTIGGPAASSYNAGELHLTINYR